MSEEVGKRETIAMMYADMVSRVPAYEKTKKVMRTYIEHLKNGALFTWAPPMDGEYPLLSAPVEKRCADAVIRELKKCIKEIDVHLDGLRDLRPPTG